MKRTWKLGFRYGFIGITFNIVTANRPQNGTGAVSVTGGALGVGILDSYGSKCVARKAAA